MWPAVIIMAFVAAFFWWAISAKGEAVESKQRKKDIDRLVKKNAAGRQARKSGRRTRSNLDKRL